jgi:hypothetical protein
MNEELLEQVAKIIVYGDFYDLSDLDRAEQALRVLRGTCNEHGMEPRPKPECFRCVVKCVARVLNNGK